MDKFYSNLTFEQVDGSGGGVNFSTLEVGTYFTDDADGSGGLYQKISKAATNNVIYPLDDRPGDLETYKPGDKVFVCDVELKWMVR